MDRKETPLKIGDPKNHQTSAILTEPLKNSHRAVVLCHGFLSNKNSRTNLRLTELLISKGISTLRFDWFGMGESGGRFADMTPTLCCDQLEQVLGFIQERGYDDVGLIGSSFGGFIATLVGANHPELSSIGLKCPVPDFPEMLLLEFGKEGIEQWKQTEHIPNVTGGTEPIRLKFQFYEDCCRLDAYSCAQHINSPVIIVHGEKDELVPLHQIRRLGESLGGKKELHLLSEADHHFGRPEDFRQMTVLLATWMTSHRSISSRLPAHS